MTTTRKIKKYIGLTGLPGSGKGQFTDELEVTLATKGITLKHYSLSDILRAHVRELGRPVERPVLREVGNALRAEHGSGVLARMTAGVITKESPTYPEGETVVVVDAIRNPEEIEVLRQTYGAQFVMVAVEAPIDVLIERIANRKRNDESADVLKEKEAARRMILAESGEGEPEHGHGIAKCIATADCHIDNSTTLDDLRNQVQGFIQLHLG